MTIFFRRAVTLDVKNGYSYRAFPATVGEESLLCLVVGRAFDINNKEGNCAPCEEDLELNPIDTYFEGDDPAESSIEHICDLEPLKVGVDLLLKGVARAPKGKKAKQWSVIFKVDDWRKELLVMGPRNCTYVRPKGRGKTKESQAPTFSEPTLVAEVPLQYEYAYGGKGRYIPDDPAAFLEAQEQEDPVTEMLKPEMPETESPKDEAKVGDTEDESWWQEAEGAEDALEEGPRKITKAKGSDDVNLDDEHLKVLDGATAKVSEDEVLDHLEGAGAVPKMDKEGEGTLLLDRDGLTDKTIVKEGWRQDLIDEKEAEGGPKPKKKEDDDSPFPLIPCSTNPVGKGFAVSNKSETIQGLELPQIEDPKAPLLPTDIPVKIEKPETVPFAAGFGPIARSWRPRASRMGLSGEDLADAREQLDDMVLKLDPNDPAQRNALMALADMEVAEFNPRFYNAAPDDQQIDRVHGTERVRVDGTSTDGPLEFTLPGRFPAATLNRGAGSEIVTLRIDTVIVDVEESQVKLFWRGRLPMADYDDFAEYPLIDVDILDLDEESFNAHMHALGAVQGRTQIFDPKDVMDGDNLDIPPEARAAMKEKEDNAWVEGVDREVSPLLLDGEALKEGDTDEALKKLKERAEKRQKVADAKARAENIAEEQKKKEQKAQAKEAKEAAKKRASSKSSSAKKKASAKEKTEDKPAEAKPKKARKKSPSKKK